MNDTFQQLEQFNRLTPLGLRFWDSVTGTVIGDGLEVSAYPLNRPLKVVTATPNRSGGYVLQNLPGMSHIENSAGDSAFWANPPQKPFMIEVRDKAGLGFVPFQFQLNLPQKGLYKWPCWPATALLASPLDPLPAGIPLFSTTARRVPAGLAVLYAELWNPLTNPQTPAAHALLEVRVTGRPPVWGIADDLGRVAVIMAYPEPLNFEPPAANQSGRALTEQIWPVELQAYYGAVQPVSALPDLCQILQQPAAFVWANTGLTNKLTRADLRYGQELQLRTVNEPNGRLLITPA